MSGLALVGGILAVAVLGVVVAALAQRRATASPEPDEEPLMIHVIVLWTDWDSVQWWPNTLMERDWDRSQREE